MVFQIKVLQVATVRSTLEHRQVQVAVGVLVVVFTLAGFGVHPLFHALAGLTGLGLINAGVTGWCGMAMLLAKMPWNRD